MLTPSRVEPHGEREILLEWNDGARFCVPYVELRFYCPCAGCVDEHTGQRTIRRSQVRQDVKPMGVQLVGRYALQISWNDKHETGMYHFERLREICEKFGSRL